MFFRPGDIDAVAVAFAARCRQGNLFAAGEILAGDGIFNRHDFFRGAVGDDLTAMDAGARPDIDDPVSGHHRLFIMLDDDQ